MINQNLLLAGDDGYNLTKSLRFRSSASAYLNRTPASSGSSTSFTYSVWVKRGIIGGYQAIYKSGVINANADIGFNSSNQFFCQPFNSVGANYGWTSTAVFRDPSAWYHFVIKGFASSSGNSYGGVELALYVNGVQQTFTGVNYASPTTTNRLTDATAKYIGIDNDNSYIFDGYLAEFNYVDGQSLNPSSFGSTNASTGVWQPAKYTGTYGTNGFYLPFTNTTSTTTLGYDFSGNSNNWTTNNISLTAGSTYDSMNDVPTLTSATTANYCVMNPLNSFTSPIPQQANLYVPSTNYALVKGTFFVSTGKWYWEWSNVSGTLPAYCGVSNASITSYAQYASSGISWYGHYDSYTKNFTATSTVAETPIAIGDIIGISVDCDAGEIKYYLNNTLVHTDTTLTPNTEITPTLTTTFSGIWANVAYNFGQRPFAYTPPTGFKALNTYNLPTSTIVKGNTVMDATLWAGNGTGARAITNTAGFKPDLVWLKDRTNAYYPQLIDSNRGVSAGCLYSNATNTEDVNYTLSSFNSNGFTLGNTASLIAQSFVSQNGTGDNYVGWQWQAGQGSTSSNTSGSITSTVSVNASAGFSVVTYTGNNSSSATVGHGLGVAPSFIVTKCRSYGPTDWASYHISIGANFSVFLDTAGASTAGGWYPSVPTSTVFYTGYVGNNGTNASGQTYVSYCWSEIAGFSKFGSYTGNGSSDGPFVYLGFRPRFILTKDITTGSFWWEMVDSARSPSNVVDRTLYANVSDAEYNNSSYNKDFLSNGFKIRNTNGGDNTSGSTYIYMAFAENPFKNALAR